MEKVVVHIDYDHKQNGNKEKNKDGCRKMKEFTKQELIKVLVNTLKKVRKTPAHLLGGVRIEFKGDELIGCTMYTHLEEDNHIELEGGSE